MDGCCICCSFQHNVFSLLDFSKKINLEISKIEIDPLDGLLTYNGNIQLKYLDIEELPREFLYFKKINGNLHFFECRNLKNVHNLKNIRCVVGMLEFQNCPSIVNLQGLENLESIGHELRLYGSDNLKFNGINSFIKIIGDPWGVKIYPKSRFPEFMDYVKSVKNLQKTEQNFKIKEILNVYEDSYDMIINIKKSKALKIFNIHK